MGDTMETKIADSAEMAIERIKKMEENNEWYSNPEANQALMIAKRLRGTKTGMYSSVPIICRAEGCPYASACELVQMNIAPYAEKCPMEIAAIEDLFGRYCRDLDIDPNDESQQVDAIMVKELVDIDVAMLRCDKKMAINADFIIDNVVGMNDEGEALVRKELHPLTEYKEKMRTQKYKTLNLLNSTRKDKHGDTINLAMSSSERASELIMVQSAVLGNDDSEEEAKVKYFDKMKRMQGGNDGVLELAPIIDCEVE